MKNRLGIFIVALLASFCLWVYVVTVVNQVVYNEPLYDIPVTFSGQEQIREDENLVITAGVDTTVDLKVTCRRTVLSKLSSDSVSVVVDVSRIKKPGDYTQTYNLVFPTGVSNSDVSANGVPSTITFTVERYLSKPVPVRGVLDGSVAEGYLGGTMTYNYDQILIEGPESVVSTVEYAQVILAQDGLTETYTASCPFTLIDADGNPVESEDVTMTVDGVAVEFVEVTQPVQMLKEVPLTLSFVDGGGATEQDVVWKVDPPTVTVAGTAEVLESRNQIVVGEYRLEEVMESLTETVPLVLPNDLVNVNGIDSVEISIDLSGLETKTLRVTNIDAINPPEGYVAEVKTLLLQTVVRGPVEEIEEIEASDLRAVADLEEAEPTKEGSYSVPVSIYIGGDRQTAVIGQYTITVTLTREENVEP